MVAEQKREFWRRTSAMGLVFAALLAMCAEASNTAEQPSRGTRALEVVDRWESGRYNVGAAEIVEYHEASRHVFVVDAEAGRVQVLELGARGFRRESDVLEPGRDLPGFSVGGVTSVASAGTWVAVAVRAKAGNERGRVAFYDATAGSFLGQVQVGFLPDMLTFTPDGRTLLVANEGEQTRDGAARIISDPEGSVSVIDMSGGVERATVRDAGFERFEAQLEELHARGLRVPELSGSHFQSGEGHVSLTRDLEPEYVAVSSDGAKAWVSLQENDAIAVLDVAKATFVDIIPLGLKDFSRGRPSLDAPISLPPLAEPARPAVVGGEAKSSEPVGLWFEASESSAERSVFYTLARPGVVWRLELSGSTLQRTSEVALEGATKQVFAGIVLDGRDHSFWLVDEASASFNHFDARGKRLETIVPTGVVGRASPAAVEMSGLSIDAEGRRLYAFVNHTQAQIARGEGASVARLLVINIDAGSPDHGEVVKEHAYPLVSSGSRVSAATFDSDHLLVLEETPREAGAELALFEVNAVNASVVRVHKREAVELTGLRAAWPRAVSGLASLAGGQLALLDGQLSLLTFEQGGGLDASDREGSAKLRSWPVFGIYMPDAIAVFQAGGREYLATVNEGDTRGYDTRRLAEAELDARAFPEAALLQSPENLGRLKVSVLDGDVDSDGDLDEIHLFGARSLSIWDVQGNQVYDTGALFEEMAARGLPGAFNSNNEGNGSFDTRSDNKGPEPEGLEIAAIGGRTYAFVGLERIGGIVVLDLTEPGRASFVDYVNPRDFDGDPRLGAAGDLGPEGLKFVPAAENPTGRPLLLVGNEVSGTTTLYQINL